MRPPHYFDWERFRRRSRRGLETRDSRHRVRWILIGFAAMLVVVFGRLVQLEVTQGAAFRAEAVRPLEREYLVPGVRGRILSAQGTVLAYDQESRALAVHYRWIEEPADPDWLRQTARRRLSRRERRDPKKLAEAEAAVLAERRAMAERMVRLTGVSAEQWRERAKRIQSRVEHIRDSVNRRRQDAFEKHRTSDDDSGDSFWSHTWEALRGILRSSSGADRFEPIRVAEEFDCHVMIDDVSVEAMAAIEGSHDDFPAVRLVARQRRTYPQGSLAAHVLGHLGVVGPEELDADDTYHPEDLVGRAGLELGFEKALRGTPGMAIERTDRSGRHLSTEQVRRPTVGRDLVLTLDVSLQRAAEKLLEEALARRQIRLPEAEPAGGAILVMDVHTGAVLAAASAPSFDPSAFASDLSSVREWLDAPAKPLFNRSIQMAIPPGSVFKVATSVALLQEGAVRPGESMHCRGYLRSPDRLRCAIYRQHGLGHGDVALSDALCQSCNVYFFHHAGRLGWASIADWAWRFGFGRPTGIDLPGEASGRLPMPRIVPEGEIDHWAELPSVGQGDLDATPVQVARMIAAVANGGRLVTPHVVRSYGLRAEYGAPSVDETSDDDDAISVLPPEPIKGLSPVTLSAIRAGLRRTVSDPVGTAYDGSSETTLSWAGKTGTAETGIDGQEHAWFAGYAPADRPEVALVVVLEHAGNASETAVPVARRLVGRVTRAK